MKEESTSSLSRMHPGPKTTTSREIHSRLEFLISVAATLLFFYKHALYKHAWAEIFHILSTSLSTLSASDLLVTEFSGKIFLAYSANLSHIFVCTSVLVSPILLA